MAEKFNSSSKQLLNFNNLVFRMALKLAKCD